MPALCLNLHCNLPVQAGYDEQCVRINAAVREFRCGVCIAEECPAEYCVSAKVYREEVRYLCAHYSHCPLSYSGR